MSEQNRASSSSVGSTRCARSSINMGLHGVHRKRVADELGMEPFQKKNKTWTGVLGKAIKEKCDELLMSTASGSGGDGVAASEPSVNSMALWVEASDGMKRQKIMGQATATSSSNATDSRRTQFHEQMAQELSRLKHLLVEKDKQIRVLEQQIQFVLQHLNLNHDKVPPVPPTNPIGDGHNDERPDDDDIADDDDSGGPC